MGTNLRIMALILHTHVHTHNMLCCSAKRWGYDYNVDNKNIK